jgi:hypothetical protein
MNKLLSKRVLIPFGILVTVAICAAGAYAWITNTVPISGGNQVTSGNMTADVQVSPDPLSVSDLMPSAGFPGGSYKTAFFAIKNTSPDPAYFRVQADLTSGDASLADEIKMTVWLQPTDAPAGWGQGEYGHPNFLLTTQPITLRSIAGVNSVLNNVHPLTEPGFVPLLPDMWAVYKIVYWLDSSATQGGKTLTFDLNAHLTQAVEGNSNPAPASF